MVFGETEVDEHRDVLDGEKDIGRFDVVVTDAVRMKEVNTAEE